MCVAHTAGGELARGTIPAADVMKYFIATNFTHRSAQVVIAEHCSVDANYIFSMKNLNK